MVDLMELSITNSWARSTRTRRNVDDIISGEKAFGLRFEYYRMLLGEGKERRDNKKGDTSILTSNIHSPVQ